MKEYLICRQTDTGTTIDLEPIDEADDYISAERQAKAQAEMDFEGPEGENTLVILKVVSTVTASVPDRTLPDVKVNQRPFG